MAISSSFVLPVMTSTSMPRSLKICAALGSILSLMRTLGVVIGIIPSVCSREGGSPAPDACGMKWQEMGPRLRGDTQKSLERSVSLVEPRAERFDIGGGDGRAAPDAQPPRRVPTPPADIASAACGERGSRTGEK